MARLGAVDCDDPPSAGGGLVVLRVSDHPRRCGGGDEPGSSGFADPAVSAPQELRGQPLVREVRRLPRILGPDEVAALMGALRTDRDRAMVQAMALGRRCVAAR